jgi:hypothetical protein
MAGHMKMKRALVAMFLTAGITGTVASVAFAQDMGGGKGSGMMQGGMEPGMMGGMRHGMRGSARSDTTHGGLCSGAMMNSGMTCPCMMQGGMRPGMMQGGMRSRMMHRGMGPGKTGGMMQSGMGGLFGPRVVPIQNLSVDDVRDYLASRLDRLGNKRLKVGDVKLQDATITAEIVTVDNSLAQSLKVDRHTGEIDYEE